MDDALFYIIKAVHLHLISTELCVAKENRLANSGTSGWFTWPLTARGSRPVTSQASPISHVFNRKAGQIDQKSLASTEFHPPRSKRHFANLQKHRDEGQTRSIAFITFQFS